MTRRIQRCVGSFVRRARQHKWMSGAGTSRANPWLTRFSVPATARAPFGDSPPLHIHCTRDETFVVPKGRLRLVLGGETIVPDSGKRALATTGMAHIYRVESPEGGQFLCITTGADFESMVRKASRPAIAATLPPAMAPSPRMIAGLTAFCAESRFDLVGAPLM